MGLERLTSGEAERQVIHRVKTAWNGGKAVSGFVINDRVDAALRLEKGGFLTCWWGEDKDARVLLCSPTATFRSTYAVWAPSPPVPDSSPPGAA